MARYVFETDPSLPEGTALIYCSQGKGSQGMCNGSCGQFICARTANLAIIELHKDLARDVTLDIEVVLDKGGTH